jgi:hypothetical protein
LRAALLFANANSSSGSSMVVRICHNYAIKLARNGLYGKRNSGP